MLRINPPAARAPSGSAPPASRRTSPSGLRRSACPTPPRSSRCTLVCTRYPALLTRMSRWPNSSPTRPTPSRTSRVEETSIRTGKPGIGRSALVAAAVSASISATATRAPCSAKRLQIASPMPRTAPGHERCPCLPVFLTSPGSSVRVGESTDRHFSQQAPFQKHRGVGSGGASHGRYPPFLLSESPIEPGPYREGEEQEPWHNQTPPGTDSA